MPITTIGSFVSTMEEFIQHWTTVNAALAPRPLTLPDGFTLANFTTLRTTLITENTAVTNAQNVVAEKREDLFNQKFNARLELELFRKTVIGDFSNTLFVAGLPTLPEIGAVESRFLTPFTKSADIWSRINANPPQGFTPPLMLPDATLLADFNTIISDLRTAYAALMTSEMTLSTAIATRNADLPQARLWMKQYRAAVYARLAPGHPLLQNIPRYTPVRGATPKGVTNILFAYNPPTNAVKLTFTPSTSKGVTEYDLRYSPDAKYNPADEQTIATLPATGPCEFDFTLDFVATDATAFLKIYVLNATGNHRASKVLKIKRTAATGAVVLQMAA